jgi:quercetin dioxygenase-like cupin family protein
MALASFIRIYSDSGGESHFEDLEVLFEEAEFVPPAPPVLMSPPQAAAAYSFEEVPPGWEGEWHPVPQRLLAAYLSGAGEMTASDGETRELVPGTVLLAEDTRGRGHASRVTGTEVMHVLILMLPS